MPFSLKKRVQSINNGLQERFLFFGVKIGNAGSNIPDVRFSDNGHAQVGGRPLHMTPLGLQVSQRFPALVVKILVEISYWHASFKELESEEVGFQWHLRKIPINEGDIREVSRIEEEFNHLN